ncbi:MAG TPA: VCBS repeat-containing protein [Holophagaceae bacterium]|nr:VCBS repeat-containing protein [Holophagaceae bacterium]
MKTTIRPLFAPLLGAALLLPLAGCLGSSSSSGPSYADNATSVAVLDLDGNGRMDVVTAFDRAYSDGTDGGFVSTRLGQGASGINFAAPLRSAGGQAPGPIVAADLDGDGHADLVMCNGASTTVTILYGSAATAGAFGSEVDLPLGANRYAYAVAVADFNGDGKKDIAVAASGGSDVLLFLQNAGGGFTGVTPSSIAVAATPYCIAAAPLSGANQDLAVGLQGGQLAILKGNGDGTFQTPVNYACGTTPASIKIADLDGVNGPDIAEADYAGTSLVWIFLNNGTGAFAAGVSYPTGDAYALDLAIGDLNGDGKLDIAVANSGVPGSPGSISVLLNTGSGAFGTATLYGGLQGPTSVAIADIDGDGKNDIVSADGVGVVRLQDPANPGQFLAPVQLYY